MITDADRIRLRHIQDAVVEVAEFLEGQSQKDFNSNRMLHLAVIKEIELIGEAASKVSKEIKELLPAVPWDLMAAMRNRLIHGYFDINLETVWLTATLEIPKIGKEVSWLLKSF